MKNISRIGITTLALAGALLGSLALAAPASASGTGTNGSTTTVCVENGAGVTVQVTETPVARSAITQTVTTGSNGCASVATSGVAKTTITASAPSLGLSGTVTYAPTAAGLVWTDSIAESGSLDASTRSTLQHKYVQADRVSAGVLTLTR